VSTTPTGQPAPETGQAPAVPVQCCGRTAYLRPGQSWTCPVCDTTYQPPPAGPVRFIDLHIVIAEPVTDELHDAAGAIFDGEVCESLRAVLTDNGYRVDTAEVVPTALLASGPPPGAVEGWPMDARQLDALLAEVAQARRVATVAYAEAFLDAIGTQLAREAAAQLAAAGPRCELETLEGRAEAFRMILAAERVTSAHRAAQELEGHATTAPPQTSGPGDGQCIYWWTGPLGPNYTHTGRAHRCSLRQDHRGGYLLETPAPEPEPGHRCACGSTPDGA
jgi:hypothetical protein